jgi:hypothetical protein
MVVQRVKARIWQIGARPPPIIEAMLAPAHRIVIGRRPAIGAGHHAHPVGAQHMQLGRQARPAGATAST